MKVKICGIRRLEDVEIINTYKPDFCGFVFAKSKRQVSLEQAKELADRIDKDIKKVGVFVNQPIEMLAEAYISESVDYLQLHGDEDAMYENNLIEYLSNNGVENAEDIMIKVYKIKSADDFAKGFDTKAKYLLLDAFSLECEGGNGISFDWSVIRNIDKPFFLAGGIGIENVDSAHDLVNPFAVDASSSLETDGFKDEMKIKALVERIRNYE